MPLTSWGLIAELANVDAEKTATPRTDLAEFVIKAQAIIQPYLPRLHPPGRCVECGMSYGHKFGCKSDLAQYNTLK